MKLKKIKSKIELSDSDKCDGYLIDADEGVARGIVASLSSKDDSADPSDRKSKKVVGVLGRSGGFNRRVVETLKIDYLVSPEQERPRVAGVSGCRGVGVSGKTDTLKQRDSGLNHVVAKEMAKRGIVVVVDFDSVAKMKGKLKALRLARIMQNVKICRKAGCKVRIWGSVDEKALRSFGFGLGMSSVQVAEAVGD